MGVRSALASAFVVLVCTVSLLAFRHARPDTDPQTPRPAAPDFTVARYSDGSHVSLIGLRGKVVLLYFFFPT